MNSMKTRLIGGFAIVIVLIVGLSAGLLLYALHSYYYGGAQDAFTQRVRVIASYYNNYGSGDSLQDKARSIFEQLSADEVYKTEVLDFNGKVIVDSSGLQSGKQVNTPDVKEARETREAVWSGKNGDTGERILASSNLLMQNERPVGIVRFSTSLERIDEAYNRIAAILLGAALAMILLSLLTSFVISRWLVKPIVMLTGVAGSMAKGNFQARAVTGRRDELGQLAETMNFMAAEIARNDALKNEFISTVSHELRTPLTSIKGWTETLLVEESSDPEELATGLGIISKESDRLAALVNDLLDFSKLQTNQIRLELHPMSVTELIGEVSNQFSAACVRRHVELEADIPDDPLLVEGDRDRLKQVVINILDNALKFSGSGGRIALRAFREEDRICMEVSDEGEGILPEDLPHLTEKFYKGKSRASGSGLGLSISKEIIELHQGMLRIESQLHQGTVMTVSLPSIRE